MSKSFTTCSEDKKTETVFGSKLIQALAEYTKNFPSKAISTVSVSSRPKTANESYTK